MMTIFKALEYCMDAISIVIITLNEAERIGNILEDLSQQTYQNFEVIVVDSDSDDNTCELAQAFSNKLPKLRVHKMQGRGTGLGRNTGAQLAEYNRLLFLDADVRLTNDFLAKSVNKLNAAKLDVAGVYMSLANLPVNLFLGYLLFNAGMFITQYGFPTAIGACLFSTKQVHASINGFDEQINLCEDCDYVNRASKISHFRVLMTTFTFDPRRLKQDGFMSTGLTYIKANTRRLLIGELKNNEIEYKFGHYDDLKNRQMSSSWYRLSVISSAVYRKVKIGK